MVEWQELARNYQSQTDDELLQLEQESEQLTPEAREQLLGELRRRKINLEPTKSLRNEDAGQPNNVSHKLNVLFPSFRRAVGTVNNWRQYKRQTGNWPALSIFFHLGHGALGLSCGVLYFWFALSHGWSRTRTLLVAITLLVVDAVLQNWIERKIRLAELRKSHTARQDRRPAQEPTRS
jgi:hypothetical protein